MVAAVVLDEPWPDYHGGSAAAPVFSAIADRVLLYLGVPPQRSLPAPEIADSPVLLARGVPRRSPGSTARCRTSRVSHPQAILVASRLALAPEDQRLGSRRPPAAARGERRSRPSARGSSCGSSRPPRRAPRGPT